MNPKDTSLPRPLPAGRLRRRVGRALLTGLTAAAVAALGPLPQAAHADGAGETVIAPLEQTGPVGLKMVGEDADGYLLQSDETFTGEVADEYRYTWASADGTVTRDIGLFRVAPVVLPRQGGGTLLAALEPDSTGVATRIGIYDPAAGTWTYDAVALPPGQRARTVVPTTRGWSVLTESGASGEPVALHLLRSSAPGQWGDTVVSTVPAGGSAMVWRSVTGALLLGTWSPGGRSMVLIDTDTQTVSYSEPWSGYAPADVVMNAHAFGIFAPATSTLTLRSIDDPRTVVTDLTVTPTAGSTFPVLTDSALILGPGPTATRATDGAVVSFPLDGSASTVLSTHAGSPLATADGGVAYDGADGTGGWATYKVPAAGGPASLVRTLTTYHPEQIGLSLDRGRLTRVETGPGYSVREHLESADVGTAAAPAQPVQAQDRGRPQGDLETERCGGVRCQALMDTDEAKDTAETSSPVYLTTDAQGFDVVHRGTVSIQLPGSRGRIVAVGSEDHAGYAVYDSGSGSDNGSYRMQYVVDFTQDRIVITQPITAITLWNGVFTSATSTPGKFTVGWPTPYSPHITTDVPCVPDELQALGRWLYWSCGDAGPAGVYDSTTHRSVRVPAGKALLGDGFVLRHVGGSLVLTDIHTGTAADRTLAGLPAGPYPDDRGITWTVDRYRGFVAYTDAGGATHVLPSGVPGTPLGVMRSTVRTDATSRGIGVFQGWSPQWRLDGPSASWQLDIRRQGHSAVVASFSGGPARSSIAVHWDGTDASGKPVLYGAYTWTLSVTPANGDGPALVVPGTVIMAGGPNLSRDYSGDYVGDLFGRTSGGRLDLRPGTGTSPGNVRRASSSGSGWPSSSLLVPFGDMNGDDVNDLLVRDAAGELTVYYGTAGHSFTPSGPHRLIGGGWNMFNLLTSPDDMTMDARPDLLARDGHGDLWLYTTTSSGTFTRRTKVGYGYQVYDQILGNTGDGDGMTAVQSGTMLARDRAGVLWFYGTDPWQGRFLPRIRIGGGWNIYTTIVGVGDLNGDDHGDLVARDAAGTLWFYAGKGGSFAPRVRMGGGWNMYQSLL